METTPFIPPESPKKETTEGIVPPVVSREKNIWKESMETKQMRLSVAHCLSEVKFGS